MRRRQLSRPPVTDHPSSRDVRRRARLAPLLPLLMLPFAGCGGVKIAPQPVLPKALVQPVPARVGFVLPPDQKDYAHNETRGGVPWSVSLGEGQRKLAREVFKASFRAAEEFEDLEVAKRAAGLQGIFEARIEQYSFATARETGGDYVAVTIRYRILLRTPRGEPVDAYTLTGYGNSEAGGMSSSTPLEMATRAAMRDAAAKFLTQFPEQPAAKVLASGQPLVAAATGQGTPLATLQAIEAVPVRASRRGKTGTGHPTPPPATLPDFGAGSGAGGAPAATSPAPVAAPTVPGGESVEPSAQVPAPPPPAGAEPPSPPGAESAEPPASVEPPAQRGSRDQAPAAAPVPVPAGAEPSPGAAPAAGGLSVRPRVPAAPSPAPARAA